MKNAHAQPREFVLVRKTEEAPGVFTCELAPRGREIFRFVPGQFVMVRFPGRAFTPPARAYSLTSVAGERRIAFAVKRMGVFSNALCDLPAGGRLLVSGPFGRFFPSPEEKNIVCLAGGIGVTPFIAYIRNWRRFGNGGRQLTLFYSNRMRQDIAFFGELNAARADAPWLSVVYALTRDWSPDPLISERRRISGAMLAKRLGSFAGKHYYICGSREFNCGMVKILRARGVGPGRIHFETFF